MAVAADECKPLTHAELEAMFLATVQFGSGNGYAGTSGLLAGMVRQLLRERLLLIEQGVRSMVRVMQLESQRMEDME